VEINKLDELDAVGRNATAGTADCKSTAATRAAVMEEVSARLTCSQIVGDATGTLCCCVTGKERLNST